MTSTILAELSDRLRQIERARVRPARDLPVSASPVAGLRQLLPGGLRGGLVEWLSDLEGAGSLSVAVLASQSAVGDRLWVFVDHRHQWHAAGLANLSLDLSRVVLVRPERACDALWVVEQSLRTRGVGGVVCEWDRLSTAVFRRLQLAAETGGTLGILLRPGRVRHQPSWAEYRLLVSPLGHVPAGPFLQPRRRVRVELLSARKEFAATKSVIVELDDADNRVCLASELAPAAAAGRATGA